MISDLLLTDMHLASLLGSVEEREDCFVVRTPDNPGFYYGNFLILKQEPLELGRWLVRFEQAFGPEVEHRCFAWSGRPLGDELAAAARGLGLEQDGSVELCLEAPPPARTDWEVRALDPGEHWESIVALNRASDGTEAAGEPSYRLFKERLRESWRRWLELDLATWWGAFDGERLVGQCGLVGCGELGRFQAVETHPGWRRRGVCSDLVTEVARDAFRRLGLRRLLLAAEVDGPALGLYRRVGFEETGRTHSLVRRGAPMRIRAELPGDQAGVRSLVTAAFGGPEEAELIAALRAGEGAISLVAEHTSSLLGHVLFSRVTIEGEGARRSAVALAPLAVRPAAQRRGVGKALVEKGLERCREAGFELCLVVGSPAYYARFGFVPAAPHGLGNDFGIEDEHFMVLELAPGALVACGGRVVYPPAF